MSITLHQFGAATLPPRRFFASATRRGRRIPSCSRGFTLIELLTVIAIIGILTAILIPTTTTARRSALKARTRAQFSQWMIAFESFRQEYGAYPQLFPHGPQKLVNHGAATPVTADHLFHDLLAGAKRDGSPLIGPDLGDPPPAIGQNTRRIRFLSFADSDFVLQDDVDAGHNAASELNFIRDAFHNTSIAVVTDENFDGVINGRDVTGGFPAVRVPGTTTTIQPTTIVTTSQTGGIHAGVIFYCAPPGATTEGDLVVSWK